MMIPSTEEMQNVYASVRALGIRSGPPGAIEYNHGKAKFDAWLAAIEREAAAKALAEFAVEIELCDMPERGVHINMTQYREGLIDGVSRAMRAASRRAAEIREGTNDDG